MLRYMRSRLVKVSSILKSSKISSEATKRNFSEERIRLDRWRDTKKNRIESLMNSGLRIKRLKLFMLATLAVSGTSTNKS